MTYRDPMLLDGWIKFNEEQWALKAQRVTLVPREGKGWELETVFYTDRSGTLVQPPRNPYIPIEFTTSASRCAVINRRKREAIDRLAETMAQYRGQRRITLDSWADDIRPFTWRNLVVQPLYTYRMSLPGWQGQADSVVFQKIRKAKKLGYTVECSTDFASVQVCLEAAETRKKFSHRVSEAGLTRLSKLLTNDCFVCFLAKDSSGVPKGARVCLLMPSGLALDWSAGVQTDALKDGVNNLLIQQSLEYFEAHGCKTFDFVGANIPSVAAMKEAWGGGLICNYSVSPRNLRFVLQEAREILRALRSPVKHGPAR